MEKLKISKILTIPIECRTDHSNHKYRKKIPKIFFPLECSTGHSNHKNRKKITIIFGPIECRTGHSNHKNRKKFSKIFCPLECCTGHSNHKSREKKFTEKLSLISVRTRFLALKRDPEFFLIFTSKTLLPRGPRPRSF